MWRQDLWSQIIIASINYRIKTTFYFIVVIIKSHDKMDNKIVEYERFVNDVLRNDLNKAIKKYEMTSQRLNEYLNVKLFIEEFKSRKIIKTQSDLGSNFYVQCKV